MVNDIYEFKCYRAYVLIKTVSKSDIITASEDKSRKTSLDDPERIES